MIDRGYSWASSSFLSSFPGLSRALNLVIRSEPPPFHRILFTFSVFSFPSLLKMTPKPIKSPLRRERFCLQAELFRDKGLVFLRFSSAFPPHFRLLILTFPHFRLTLSPVPILIWWCSAGTGNPKRSSRSQRVCRFDTKLSPIARRREEQSESKRFSYFVKTFEFKFLYRSWRRRHVWRHCPDCYWRRRCPATIPAPTPEATPQDGRPLLPPRENLWIPAGLSISFTRFWPRWPLFPISSWRFTLFKTRLDIVKK